MKVKLIYTIVDDLFRLVDWMEILVMKSARQCCRLNAGLTNVLKLLEVTLQSHSEELFIM